MDTVTSRLSASLSARLRRAGQSRYLVEPNVKDSKGGLRDLHTLFWIAKYVYRVRETGELVERGVFDAQEYRTFRRCADFLWSVRCNLHFVSGRAEERLSFDRAFSDGDVAERSSAERTTKSGASRQSGGGGGATGGALDGDGAPSCGANSAM